MTITKSTLQPPIDRLKKASELLEELLNNNIMVEPEKLITIKSNIDLSWGYLEGLQLGMGESKP